MKIESIDIKNFKILRNSSIQLGDFTLLSGLNSSGKSSIIQALLLLKQNQINLEIIKYFKGNKKRYFELNGDYIQLGRFQDILNIHENTTIELKFNVKKHTYNLSFNEDLLIQIQNKVDYNFLNDCNLFSDRFQYLKTHRMEPRHEYPLSKQNINNHLIGLSGEYTAHYLDEYRREPLNIQSLKHPKSQTDQLLENVSYWLGEISEGIEVATENNLRTASLFYSYPNDQHRFKHTPVNVGFGITYVLPIIVSILKAKPNDLIIIENPETHLHPKGQVKIAQLCAIAASCGVQIIVKTHSDHILNGIRVAVKNQQLSYDNTKIYYCQKKYNQFESIIDPIPIDQYGNIHQWPKGFFDEWDNQLNQLLDL